MDEKKIEIYEKFCSTNGKYWPKIDQVDAAHTILVEGFFAESGPNYVIRIGAIVRTMQEILRGAAVVVLASGRKKEPNKIKIWESFKLENFVGMSEDVYKKFSFAKKLKIRALINFYYLYSKILLSLGKSDSFLNLKFKGMVIGDFIYDEIIKENELVKESSKKNYTITKIRSKHKKFFKRAMINFHVFEAIYEKYRPSYYVTTHIQYIAYGLPSRYLAHKGVTVIETTDDMLFIYDDRNFYPPKFHKQINKMIKKTLQNGESNEARIALAKRELNNRFTGKMEQIDVKAAYADKHQYSLIELKRKLGITNDNPIVFIFAHIFSDTPRGANDKILFIDFYKWLYETIKYVKDLKDINWVVKPHPSVQAYGEVGEVEKIVSQLCKADSTVYVCPADFSTASVLNCAKAIVTIQGTVGLEFSCMGIPIIITGKAFYSGFGFTHEPETKEEYFTMLRNVKNIEPLGDDKMDIAKCVYAAFFEIQKQDFALIDTKLKALTWGIGVKQDVDEAFKLMTERLENTDPRNMVICSEIRKYFQT